jgi:hypothetical protein
LNALLGVLRQTRLLPEATTQFESGFYCPDGGPKDDDGQEDVVAATHILPNACS